MRIRIPYYRGIWASLLEGADLTVDGEEFARDGILWTLGDRTLTLAEVEAVHRRPLAVRRAGRARPSPKTGGLAVGMHEIGVQAGLPGLVHAARHGAMDHARRAQARRLTH